MLDLSHLHRGWDFNYTTMILSSREDKKLMQLVAEIDKEVRGKNRGFMIENRTRQIRLLFNKAARREKNTLL
jgi:hypothetical protein